MVSHFDTAFPASSLQRDCRFLTEFVLATERESFLDSLEAGLLEPRADLSPEQAEAFSGAVSSILRTVEELGTERLDPAGWAAAASLCGNHPYAVAFRARAAIGLD